MILSEFKELMLSKTISRKVIPDDIRLQERVFTALKKIAMDTIPLRLVVQDPTGHSIMRRVDEVTYIRFPDMPLYDDSEIDIDMFLLDAAALYVMAGLEKEKASIYMGMYWEILTENDNRLCETYLSTATNESGFDDADFKYSNRGSQLVVNYGQSSGSTAGDMQKSTYDTNNSGVVDNAEAVNGFTVGKSVPANAVFTDTIYNDTVISQRITNLENEDFVIDANYVHTSNNFTSTLKGKLDGIAENANNYSHPTSGVTAGTYKSVTVNANGHITNGANPTTLNGFGINDAYTKTEVQTVLPKVGFDLTNIAVPEEGRLAWNIDEGTLDLGLYGAVLQIGQEFVVKVRNTSGSTITNGTVVMATGSIGNSGRITVSPHNGTIANATNILGVLTQDIVNNGDGFATILGKVRGIDTTGTSVSETWTDGTKLYVKPNNSGRLTNIEPLDTETKMSVAYVIKAHTNGTLYVRILGFDENHYKAWVQAKLNLKADITYVDNLTNNIANGNIGSGTQSFNGFGGSGFKNYIINGNFDIWQYATSQTTTGYGSDDRWTNYNNISTKTHSQVACTDTERALFNASNFSRTISTYVSGTSSVVKKTQHIEDITRLASKTVTISFWARADSNKKMNLQLVDFYGTGGTTSTNGTMSYSLGNVDLTNVWNKYKITTHVPSIIGKTLGTNGVHTSSWRLDFTFTASPDRPEVSSFGLPEGQSGTFDIAQVQLEEGSIATPFEQRPYGLELSLCQRYLPSVGFNDGMFGFSYNSSTSAVAYSFKVTPRIPPTGLIVSSLAHFVLYNGSAVQGTPTALSFNVAGLNVAEILVTTTAASPTLIVGQGCNLRPNNSGAKILFTGCEL